MKYLLLIFLVTLSCKNSDEKKVTSEDRKSTEQIHRDAILVDTHNDILTQTMDKGLVFDTDLNGKTHSDLKRMKEGGLDVQFFSVWSDGNQLNPFDFANRQIDSLDAVISRNPEKIAKVTNSEQLNNVVSENKIAAMVGIEGGHQIENSLENLEELYNRGTRYMTLTWNNSTDWATSASDETAENGTKNSDGKNGLTDFGRQVVRKMNDLGMMIDVSHVGEQTFKDVIATTNKPIIASHSSVYAIAPHSRNLKDYQIKAIAQNGGVIQINFYSGFIDSTFTSKRKAIYDRNKVAVDSMQKLGIPEYLIDEALYTKSPEDAENLRAPFELLMSHFEYIIDLVGIDYVGIGSDFDGIELTPKNMDDVTKYPEITKYLVDKGYTEADIDKILGGNLLRVLKANENLKK